MPLISRNHLLSSLNYSENVLACHKTDGLLSLYFYIRRLRILSYFLQIQGPAS